MKTLRRYSKSDRAIVREAVGRLPWVEQQVLTLQFWEGLSLTEVSALLGIDWGDAAAYRRQAFETLRNACLSHPEFLGAAVAAA